MLHIGRSVCQNVVCNTFPLNTFSDMNCMHTMHVQTLANAFPLHYSSMLRNSLLLARKLNMKNKRQRVIPKANIIVIIIKAGKVHCFHLTLTDTQWISYHQRSKQLLPMMKLKPGNYNFHGLNSQIRYNDLMHHSICARTYMFQMMPGPAGESCCTTGQSD